MCGMGAVVHACPKQHSGVVYLFLLNGLAWSTKAIWLTLTPGDTDLGPIGAAAPAYTYLGCYKDAPAAARALPNLLNVEANDVAGGGCC